MAHGERIAKLTESINSVIVGKPETVADAVCALVAAGHILIEDVPGVGKTVLAKAIAKAIDGQFGRIQFTADLLPSDITGVNTFRQDTAEFTFRPGPLFANVLLGDEINRATPRTQSSLLEAMEEAHATVDGEEHALPSPFLVLATQNPIELEGTYPLPFAQMDRFLVRLQLGYLDADGETAMLKSRMHDMPLDDLEPAITCDELVAAQEAAKAITVSDDLVRYIVALVQTTRHTEDVAYGASPRAGLDLLRFSQAKALVAGRDYVEPDDIKAGARPVLAHRLIVRKGTRHATADAGGIIDTLLQQIEVPL